MQEPQNEPKLIFGLSPKSTIINAILIAVLSQLFWAMKFCEQIPYGIDYANPPADLKLADNVPWYYDLPLEILAMILASSWLDYKFKITRDANGKSNITWDIEIKKFIYIIGGIMVIAAISKFIWLYTILSLR